MELNHPFFYKNIRLSWRPYLPAAFLSTRASNDAPFGFPEVQAVCRNSDLYHSKAIEERVDKFLQDLYFQSNSPSFGASLTQPSVVPAKNDHSPQFYVRIVNNEAQISVDASGELLHKRASGDKHISKAPLRETMASACLHAAGWKSSNEQADRPLLWDPFCGSGTIVLEALDILNPTGRTQQAPSRHFAFEQWSSHSSTLYLRFLQSLHAASSSSPSSSEFNQTSHQNNNHSLLHVSAVGSDIDEKCIEASRHNLSEASPLVQRKGRFYRGDFEEVLTKQLLPQLRAKNKDKKRDILIVTNLPYGIRTSPKGKELEKLFLRFGQMMSRHKDLLREAFVLDGSPGHVFPKVVTGASNLGLECRSVLRFSNRGIPVQLHRVSPL
ncbi:putative N6-adenine-specific DNA methylase, variant 2 [Balamuthia mandrillaris]